MASGRCPQCGRFLADLDATVRPVTGGYALDAIRGTCRRHGRVDAEGDFWWEDFYSEDGQD